jgi:rare lipoprotein A
VKPNAECGMMNDERKTRCSTHHCFASSVPLSLLIVHRLAVVVAMSATVLSGCGTVSRQDSSAGAPTTAPSRGGGYYLDDGPGANAPANIDAIPDAVPKIETLNRGTMRPYAVMGKNYAPMTRLEPYKARGVASWYGRRYHGKQTSSGEIYDMYAMTAAHTVLPIPSYVRVTNVANGKSVVLRVNDRGPFIDSRLIDLSYTAAYKLGILGGGSGMVEVESIIPGASPAAPQPTAELPRAPSPGQPVVTVIDNTPVATAPLPPPGAAPAVPVVAAAPAVASVPAPAATPPPAAPGPYLQFGAFGVQVNAESYLARLQTDAGWLSGTLRIEQSGGMYRVQAGPYASEVAAREAADRAAQTLGSKPVLINR